MSNLLGKNTLFNRRTTVLSSGPRKMIYVFFYVILTVHRR